MMGRSEAQLSGEVRELLAAISEDLMQLSVLQAAEPTAATLRQLTEIGFPDNLGFRLLGKDAKEALETLRQGIAGLPQEITAEVLDTLAVDFADIYLNHTFGASPCESVWIDEENLALQAPRFQVKELYKRFDLQAKDWRQLSEDHLVLQLEFLSYLCGSADSEEMLEALAAFLDEHPLRWLNQFAERVSRRAATRYFGGLARLTAAYLDEMRSFLEVVLEETRPTAAEIEARLKAAAAKSSSAQPLVQIGRAAYIPGAEPSW